MEVGFEPISGATVETMATGAVLLEIVLSSFQILQSRVQQVRLFIGMALGPPTHDVTS